MGDIEVMQIIKTSAMTCMEPLPLELDSDYMNLTSSSDEVTYTELLPLNPSNCHLDSPYDDKENDITYLNPLSPVFMGVAAPDQPVTSSYFSLSALHDDGFIAKLATIDKPCMLASKPLYHQHYHEESNDCSNDSLTSNEYPSNTDLNASSAHSHSSESYNDLPEINTKDIAEKVLNELRKHNIAQHRFARKILHRSQGTLSDLLRNPKPWSKMKNGRETFHKLLLWLQTDEQQRLQLIK